MAPPSAGTGEFDERISRFIDAADFAEKGALVLDLDGTALIEERGHIYIPSTVRDGVKAFCKLGIPVIMNTLRFPLSVMRTIGLDWYDISNRPIPTVLLNGAILGNIRRNILGILVYEELEASPLSQEEIGAVVERVRSLLEAGLTDIAVFYYPRNWIEGELIWTPNRGETSKLKRKYPSSTQAYSSSVDELRDDLARLETCMVFLLVNEEHDKLMAYQHTNRASYFTHAGVDKSSGAKSMLSLYGRDPADAIGAGDTPIDTFLSEVGLAIHVGAGPGPYEGRHGTVRAANPFDLGMALCAAARLLAEKRGLMNSSSLRSIFE